MVKKQKYPKILKVFKDLLPALDAAELQLLEDNILENGIMNDIVVWKNFVVDGHNRLKIAKKHNLDFRTRELSNEMTKEDVMAWMINHQLGQRNCSLFAKVMAALDFGDYFVKQAKLNMQQSKGPGKKGVRVAKNIDSLQEIGKLAGVSRNLVSQVKYIVENAPKEVIDSCKSGKISISNGYLRAGDKVREKRRKAHIQSPKNYKNPPKGEYLNQIINGDCIEIMQQMAKKGLFGKITCIICSPPYNNGLDYGNGHNDSLPHKKYINWLGNVFKVASSLLRPGGRLIVNVASMVNRDKEDSKYKHTTSSDLIAMMQELDKSLIYRDEIIWHKFNGTAANTGKPRTVSAYNPTIKTIHESIIIWSKGQLELPNLTNQESDITVEEFEIFSKSVWNISSLTRNQIHPASYPEKLIIPLIKLYSYPGDIILDPFNGSGTTTAAAAKLSRMYIGIEKNSNYCHYALKRVEKANLITDNEY